MKTAWTEPLAGSSLRPSCSSSAVKSPGPESSVDAGLPGRSLRVHCRLVLVVAFLLIAPVIAAHAQSAPVVVSGDQRFHFTEKPGPEAVGLKVVEQYDFSRSYRSVTDELG